MTIKQKIEFWAWYINRFIMPKTPAFFRTSKKERIRQAMQKKRMISWREGVRKAREERQRSKMNN